MRSRREIKYILIPIHKDVYDIIGKDCPLRDSTIEDYVQHLLVLGKAYNDKMKDNRTSGDWSQVFD